MKTSQAEWAGIRQQFIDHATRQGVSLRLRDRVWAVSPKGEWVALPGSSDSPNADAPQESFFSAKHVGGRYTQSACQRGFSGTSRGGFRRTSGRLSSTSYVAAGDFF